MSEKTDSVDACPRCGRSRLSRRTETEPAYRCLDCDLEFDEPDEKPPNIHRRLRRVFCTKCGNPRRVPANTVEDGEMIFCSNCDEWFDSAIGSLVSLRESSFTKEIARGPVSSSGDETVHYPNNDIRGLIEKLELPKTSQAPMRFDVLVYYLVGDERSAMRLFCEENEEAIRAYLDENDTFRLFSQSWNDARLQLFKQTWFWCGFAE